MSSRTIEDVVKDHILFPFGVNHDGWHVTYCEYCGDGKREKGPRGGWKFDGEFCLYGCFNCGALESFSTEREFHFSKNMWDVFQAFDVPLPEVCALIAENRPDKPKEVKAKISTAKEIDVPDYMKPLSEVPFESEVGKEMRDYLWGRGIDPQSHPFHISTGKTSGDNVEKAFARKMMRRVIVPFLRNGSWIYYQGRSIDPDNSIPYVNPSIPKTNILFGMDRLYERENFPLFVAESVFDALAVNGMGSLGNKLSAQQIAILERSPRPKVIIPDRKGDVNTLAEQAIELGWSISLPDIGTCKDIGESIKRYGKLYTVREVGRNIHSGDTALAKLRLLDV